MALDQLFFEDVIVEADELHRAAQDELRSDVQRWFDELTPRQKDALGAWMDSTAQYDTCVALHAAAGDWNRTRHQQLRKCLVNGRRSEHGRDNS
jgi:hypothetical protein